MSNVCLSNISTSAGVIKEEQEEEEGFVTPINLMLLSSHKLLNTSDGQTIQQPFEIHSKEVGNI